MICVARLGVFFFFAMEQTAHKKLSTAEVNMTQQV